METISTPPTFAPLSDDAGDAKDVQVMRKRWPTDAERLDEIENGAISCSQQIDDTASSWISNCLKHAFVSMWSAHD